MKLLLHVHGHRAETAADGQAAIDVAVRSRPDVILMDIAMPGMDGLTATRELRAKAETRDIPVVVISAYGGQSRWISEAINAGVTDVLGKPVSWPELERVLRRLA